MQDMSERLSKSILTRIICKFLCTLLVLSECPV